MSPSGRLSAWVGSFHPLPPNHHHHPAAPIVHVGFSGCELFEPSIGLGGLAPPSFCPTSTIPPLPFSEFVVFIPWFFEPSWPGTGPFKPSIRPFHRLLTDHVENATIQHRVSVWMGSFPFPSDPPLPSALLHRRSANRAPSTPGIDLGGLDRPPSCPMRHHSFTDDIFGDFRRRGPYLSLIHISEPTRPY